MNIKRAMLIIALHTTILYSNDFHDAVRQNNIEQVNKLLLTHNVDELDEDGNTPLYRAAQYGHLEIAEFLLEHNADVNAQNQSGASSLFPAVWYGHTKMVQLLLENRADVHTKAHYNNSISILTRSALKNQHEIEDILIKYGSPMHRLHNAVARNEIERVKELLLSHKVNELDEDGNTPLYIAAEYGHLEIAKLLLENLAYVNAKNEDGNSCLFSAIAYSHRDIVKLLIEHGADVNAQNKFGNSCLYQAAKHNCQDIVKLLIENDANVNAKNEDGNSCLFSAIAYGHRDIVKLLIEQGADVNAKNAKKLTPVYIATFHAQNENYQPTPLHIAAHLAQQRSYPYSPRQEIIQLLMQNQALCCSKNMHGKTPVDIARDGYNGNIILSLLALCTAAHHAQK